MQNDRKKCLPHVWCLWQVSCRRLQHRTTSCTKAISLILKDFCSVRFLIGRLFWTWSTLISLFIFWEAFLLDSLLSPFFILLFLLLFFISSLSNILKVSCVFRRQWILIILYLRSKSCSHIITERTVACKANLFGIWIINILQY